MKLIFYIFLFYFLGLSPGLAQIDGGACPRLERKTIGDCGVAVPGPTCESGALCLAPCCRPEFDTYKVITADSFCGAPMEQVCPEPPPHNPEVLIPRPPCYMRCPGPPDVSCDPPQTFECQQLADVTVIGKKFCDSDCFPDPEAPDFESCESKGFVTCTKEICQGDRIDPRCNPDGSGPVSVRGAGSFIRSLLNIK